MNRSCNQGPPYPEPFKGKKVFHIADSSCKQYTMPGIFNQFAEEFGIKALGSSNPVKIKENQVFEREAIQYLYNFKWSFRNFRIPVSYTHLRAHETDSYLVCR